MEQAREVRLSEVERGQLRRELEAWVEQHPVSSEVAVRRLWQRSTPFANFLTLLKPMSIVLALVLLLGGGLSAAAEQALPGDLLYPVKTSLNEEVRGWVALSPAASANWEAQRAERRLEEAEQLAVRGRLDGDAQAQVQANFEQQAGRVRQRIAAFQARSDFAAAADVSANFETALRAHERILAGLAGGGITAGHGGRAGAASARAEMSGEHNLLVSINQAARQVADERDQAEVEISSSGDARFGALAEQKQRQAARQVAETRDLLTQLEATVAASVAVGARSQLSLADQAVAEGSAQVVAGAYADAFLSFQRAEQLARSVKLLLRASRELKVEVDFEGTDKGDAKPVEWPTPIDGGGRKLDKERESSNDARETGKLRFEVPQIEQDVSGSGSASAGLNLQLGR